jgi:hypothetical protein
MASTLFPIESYDVTLSRDSTVGFGQTKHDASIRIKGAGIDVILYFVNDGVPFPENSWLPDRKFGHIYLRRTMLPTVIDVLRNEKPVYCQMSDTVLGLCRISTSTEPVGEGEA